MPGRAAATPRWPARIPSACPRIWSAMSRWRNAAGTAALPYRRGRVMAIAPLPTDDILAALARDAAGR